MKPGGRRGRIVIFHGLRALVLSRVPSSNKSTFLKIVCYDHASTKMNILFIKTLSDVKLIYLFLSFKRQSFGGPPEMLQAQRGAHGAQCTGL